jgi:hypothetical protein
MLNPGYAQLLLNWFALFKGLRGITITTGKNEDLDEAQMLAALVELGELIGAALASVETIRFNQRMLFERYGAWNPVMFKPTSFFRRQPFVRSYSTT